MNERTNGNTLTDLTDRGIWPSARGKIFVRPSELPIYIVAPTDGRESANKNHSNECLGVCSEESGGFLGVNPGFGRRKVIGALGT